MYLLRTVVAVVTLLFVTDFVRAGLYYSGEQIADLPSQWRGFLLDQRALRLIAVNPPPGAQPSPGRVRYREAADRLQKTARERKLSADELADLGALHVRLGEAGKALEVLRSAQREHPHHFRIAANLGTAWQLDGNLAQAADALQEAVRLAPGKYQKAEEYHLKLVRLRQRQPRDSQELDDLFGVRFVGESGQYEPGKLAAAQQKRLPSDAAAVVQQLALWLPADGRLLWQLAELASVHGDVRTAAAIFDGCVTEFALFHPELRRHRQVTRTTAEQVVQGSKEKLRTEHEVHAGTLKPRSSRPLASKVDDSALPPIRPNEINALPWAVLNETTLDRHYRPTFPRYLKELNNKRVALSGFMQPLSDDLELASFILIEYPVGCWFCENPEISGIVYVELPEDKTVMFTRGQVRIVGRLTLNSTDPENFLYTLSDATVTGEE